MKRREIDFQVLQLPREMSNARKITQRPSVPLYIPHGFLHLIHARDILRYAVGTPC
jgi:hypothetical protein